MARRGESEPTKFRSNPGPLKPFNDRQQLKLLISDATKVKLKIVDRLPSTNRQKYA